MVLSIKSNHLVLWFLHCKFKQTLTWLVILVFKLKHQPVSFFYSGFTSRYSKRFLIRLEKWRCVIKPKKFPNIYWKFLKTFFRFLIFWYFLFICCCHHSWFQQQSYKLDWTLCYTARKIHYFLCRIRKSRSLIVVLWLQYSTTFCLLYHGRVIPKSMSTVIVLDDDLRDFNCFREQMGARIHGVFNNSRVVCQGNHFFISSILLNNET